MGGWPDGVGPAAFDLLGAVSFNTFAARWVIAGLPRCGALGRAEKPCPIRPHQHGLPLTRSLHVRCTRFPLTRAHFGGLVVTFGDSGPTMLWGARSGRKTMPDSTPSARSPFNTRSLWQTRAHVNPRPAVFRRDRLFHARICRSSGCARYVRGRCFWFPVSTSKSGG